MCEWYQNVTWKCPEVPSAGDRQGPWKKQYTEGGGVVLSPQGVKSGAAFSSVA